ncbi:hypothetical protein CRUP_032991 [Coryphaenoides rupestris]|nr:hypothetical protein CRUP_032991 [Coryphaenoides rupestris]
MDRKDAPYIPKEPEDPFVYNYETLRIGGLTFAAIIVLMSIFLLAGNKIRNCGKSKPKPVEKEDHNDI